MWVCATPTALRGRVLQLIPAVGPIVLPSALSGIRMAAWKKWLPSRPFAWLHSATSGTFLSSTPNAELENVREHLLHLLDDCQGTDCERLRWRLHTAESAQDLWLLRGPLFQVVASQHCQQQAAERVNGLVPAFQGLMPARLLSRV